MQEGPALLGKKDRIFKNVTSENYVMTVLLRLKKNCYFVMFAKGEVYLHP